MKVALSAVALCVLLGGSTNAFAEHHDSKLGIGVASTPFVDGLGLRYGLTKEIGIEVVTGIAIVSADDAMGESTTVTNVNLGARALYGLWDFGARARVLGFGGLSFGFSSADGADTLIGIEGGLKTEFFIMPYSSISFDLGAAIGINDGFAGDTMGGTFTTVDIGTGNLYGGGAWNFWW